MIGVGRYAEQRASIALKDPQSKVVVDGTTHRSPINPQANKNWRSIALQQLTELGVMDIIKSTIKESFDTLHASASKETGYTKGPSCSNVYSC